MPLENATRISELDPANPLGSDSIGDGDNHIRMIKQVLQNEQALDVNKIRHYTLAEAKALAGAVVGQIVQITDRGNAQFEYVELTSNNGMDFVYAVGSGLTLSYVRKGRVLLEHLGVTSGVDSTEQVQRLFDLGDDIGAGDGVWIYTQTINLTKRFDFVGSGVKAGPTYTGDPDGCVLKFVPDEGVTDAFSLDSLDWWSFKGVHLLGAGRDTGNNEVCLDTTSDPDGSESQWDVQFCRFEDWNKAGFLLSAQWQGVIQNNYFQKCGDTTDISGGSVQPSTGGIVFEESNSTLNWAGSSNDIANNQFISCSYGVYNDKGWNVVLRGNVFEACAFPYYKSAAGTLMMDICNWMEDFGSPSLYQEPVIEGPVIRMGGRSTTGADNAKYRQFDVDSVKMEYVAYTGTQDCKAGFEITRHDLSTQASKLRLGTTNTDDVFTNKWEVTQEGNLDPVTDDEHSIGSPLTQAVKNINARGFIAIGDGITAPGANTGFAKMYVDSVDGDLKIIFGDGTVKTIVTDT